MTIHRSTVQLLRKRDTVGLIIYYKFVKLTIFYYSANTSHGVFSPNMNFVSIVNFYLKILICLDLSELVLQIPDILNSFILFKTCYLFELIIFYILTLLFFIFYYFYIILYTYLFLFTFTQSTSFLIYFFLIFILINLQFLLTLIIYLIFKHFELNFQQLYILFLNFDRDCFLGTGLFFLLKIYL